MNSCTRYLVLTAIGFLLCYLSSLHAQDLPWVQVSGNQFVPEDGKPLVFKGLDASDPDKLEKDGHWNPAYFQQIKSWNANVVRFPIHPRAWRKRGKEEYLKLLDDGIEMANNEKIRSIRINAIAICQYRIA